MKFSFNLIDSNEQISKKILQALLPDIDDYLKNNLQKLKQALPTVLKSIIENTPEYSSIVGGQLQYELGIVDPVSKLTSIIDIWINNIQIEYQNPVITSNKIKASFSVSLIRSDFSDVLSSDAASVIDNLRGYQLPWLEWLLLEGNKTIISKQEVIFGPNRSSRTGYAIMKPSTKSWKVPSEFAGTINDNWITRAIDGGETEINDLLNRIFN